MNTKSAQSYLKKENAKWPRTLSHVPQETWPQDGDTSRLKVMRSCDFLVQVFNEGNAITRLSVNRTMTGYDGRWVDGITWDELQDLKRQAGYGDFMAVEIYPDDFNKVNVANMRHLWILPEPLPFAWKRRG